MTTLAILLGLKWWIGGAVALLALGLRIDAKESR